MKKSDNNQTVYWLLMQVMFQAKHRIHEIAEQHDLTLMQSNTLTMLHVDAPVAMSALSNYFMCDASNVTGLADRLESRGLVKRQDHPTDRRIKLLAITPAGAKLRDKLIAETVAAEAVRLNPILSADERQQLHGLLEKILSAQLVAK